MNQQIVKHEIDHVINLALFRNKGDVFAVSKETGVSVDYVKRVYHKLKKKRERDVSFWLASGIMKTIFEGYQQRTTYLQRYLNLLDGNEGTEVSDCCKRPITKKINKKSIIVYCTACGKSCNIKLLPKDQTFELFFEVLSQLREEDRALVDFADSLGFTNKETPPTIKQNILVMDNKTIQIDSEISKGIDSMTPAEREKTRKKLETLMITSSDEDKPNEQKTH